MGIYRGPGGTGDAVNDASSEALITVQAKDAAIAAQAAAELARDAAQLAETNAETAETNAETAETNAETAATNAASSASAASTSASNAASSASAASTSASNASTSASNAASSASAASTSASNAASSASTATTQATNASNSASAAATSATNASNSASAAATSATNAANSATAAQTAQTAAELAETNAETAEANAETAETNAAASASAAATSATNASNSASAASTSATNASNSASAAATSATNASNSASAASTSATNASNSASAAATSASNAAASYDSFDDRYLGAKSTAPTLDNDGNTLLVGALYYDTVSSSMKVWSGSTWLDAYASLSGALLATNNLSDLNNTATARTNLGVAIGTDVQAYDADTAKLDVAQSWSAAQSFNAGVTLGDASGDALTINSSAVSIPNGLNFDSNTLVIDATNNRVGVGTASPATNLQVSAGESRLRLTATNASGNSWELVSGGGGITGAGFFSLYDLTNASQRVVVASGSGEAMRITSAGNVGIGTSSPDKALTVTSAMSFKQGATTRGIVGCPTWDTSYIAFQNGTLAESAANTAIAQDQNGTTFVNAASGQSLQLKTGNSERMRIDSSGNLGLGVTPSAWGRVGFEIGVVGASITRDTRDLVLLSNAYWASGGLTYAAGAGAGRFDVGVSGFKWFTAPSGTAGNAITFTQAMTLDASGNLLLGTTSSTGGKFHMQGNYARLTDGTYTGLFGKGSDLIVGGGASDLGIRSDAAILFSYGSTERMRIDSSGNVGIGTSSPTATLTVAHSNGGSVDVRGVSADGARIRFYNNAATTNQLQIGQGFGTGSDNVGYVYNIANAALVFGTNNTERMRIDSSGNVGIGTSSPSHKLQVEGSGTVASRTVSTSTSGDAAFFAANTVGSIVGPLVYGTTKSAYGALGSGETAFYSNATTTIMSDNAGAIIKFATGGNTERMRITSGGNVGIGTSSPSSNLVVNSSTATQFDLLTNGTRYFSAYTDASQVILGGIQNTIVSFRQNDTERMQLDTSGNLRFNSGYGSVATAYGCRAWVNFNGTSTVSIRGSGNVSSITDNGTGSYTVNLTTAMPDANYAVIVGAGSPGTRDGSAYAPATSTPTSSAFVIRCWGSNAPDTVIDHTYVLAAVFR